MLPKMIIKLISMVVPVAGGASALLSIYDGISFLMSHMDEIAALVNRVIGALGRIMAGDIGPAARAIEDAMAGTLPLVLKFLFRLMGINIDSIGDRIKSFLGGIRKRIDAALTKLIDFIVKHIPARLITHNPRHTPPSGHGGSPGPGAPATSLTLQQQLDHVMVAALRALAKYNGKRERAADLQPVLDDVKQSKPYSEYKIQTLKPVPDPNGEYWDVYGEINPKTSKRTFVLVDRSTIQPAGPYSSRYIVVENGRHMLKPQYRIKEFTRDACYGKSYRDPINQWKRRLLNTDYTGDPTTGLRNPQNHDQYWHNGQYYTNTGTTVATIDHQPMIVQHWNTTGRNTNQDTRKDYFNGHGITLTIVPKTLNSSDGASAGHEYKDDVGPNFRGPRE